MANDSTRKAQAAQAEEQRQDLLDRIEELEQQLAGARAEAERDGNLCGCIWCGETVGLRTDLTLAAKVRSHLGACQKNPLVHEIKRLEATLQAQGWHHDRLADSDRIFGELEARRARAANEVLDLRARQRELLTSLATTASLSAVLQTRLEESEKHRGATSAKLDALEHKLWALVGGPVEPDDDLVEAIEQELDCSSCVDQKRDLALQEAGLADRAVIEHNYVAHEREGWSVCTRCGMVRNYDQPIAGCRGVTGNIAVRGGMTMTVVEEEPETSVCSVCARPTGFGEEDKGDPPVDLARCPSPGGMECRAVAQAVAPWRRENETLRSNCDHLSSENASLARQVESMAMRIESLAGELAKPEDVRLREVVDALDGRAVIFDGLGARIGHLLDETDEWIVRAGEAERRADEYDAKLTAVRVALTEVSSCRATNAKPSDAPVQMARTPKYSVGQRIEYRDDTPGFGTVLEVLPRVPGKPESGFSYRANGWGDGATGERVVAEESIQAFDIPF